MNYKSAVVGKTCDKHDLSPKQKGIFNPKPQIMSCGFSNVITCTVPNCMNHRHTCRKCKEMTCHVKVFRLNPEYDNMVDHYVPETADYVYDYVCVKCFPPPTSNTRDIDESRFHNIKCYGTFCRCHLYYCSVDGCDRYCRNRNHGMHLPMSNGKEAKCKGHEMFCISCKKETFWVIGHAFEHQMHELNKDYVCTNVYCGPCYGYRSTYVEKYFSVNKY